MRAIVAAVLAVASLAAMSGPPVISPQSPLSEAVPSGGPPSTALKGRLVQEGPAERSQTILRAEDGTRWAVDCIPPAVLQNLRGKSVELEGLLREAPALLGVKRICAHKVVVPPGEAGEPSVDSILLSLPPAR
jgi:hypothetical protein